MGIAVGSIGMSLNDFCACTPREFHSIYRNWERMRMRDPWERTRFLACCVLQPYSKKTLKVTDVCRFSWDAERKATAPAAESTRERFEMLKKRMEEKE